MTALDMAKQYYPRLWSEERVVRLAQAGRITAAEASEIVGHEVQVPDPAPDSMVDKLAAAYQKGVNEA